MNDYENKHELIANFFGAAAGITIFLLVNACLLSSRITAVGAVLVNLVLYASFLYMQVRVRRLWNKRKDRLEGKIMEKLKYNGFECRMYEGHIRITRQEKDMAAYVVETNHPRIWTVVFNYPFSADDINRVSWVGYDVLSAEANARFPIKVRFLRDRFECMYQCAIGDANDFMVEYQRAWDITKDCLDWMSSQWERTKELFPAEISQASHKVGFQMEGPNLSNLESVTFESQESTLN